MEDYSSSSFIAAFIRFACRVGYPKHLMPDEGSQLVKGCKNMIPVLQTFNISFICKYETCPVGTHHVHGKVERKIQQIKKSISRNVCNERLSVIQWETLGQQISNSINNLPIDLGNKVQLIESLDILTPNRLLLGRNNDRCPSGPLELSNNYKGIIKANSDIFQAWFKAWLISYVPTLIDRPKWFQTDRDMSVGDVVLFL